MNMRTVRIVSDGSILGTRITLAESGQEIQVVNRIDIRIDANPPRGMNPVSAVVHILEPELEITAEAALGNIWPPPEHIRRIFQSWQLWAGPERTEPTPAELQHIHNMAEFARFGLQRIN